MSLEYPDDGITLIYFLDAKSYLPAKVETRYSATKGTEPTIAFENYKKVNGINVAHAWIEFSAARDNSAYGLPNVSASQIRSTLQKVEINPKIGDSNFLPRGIEPEKKP